MTEDTTPASQPAEGQPRWQAIGSIDRRVVGVLAEKAKTTPSAYPMSLNAICTGSNQKSNRFPVMHLEPENVEESLDRLRELGAVGMIEGYGRVVKYRHYLYDWLGVDKVELAVMAELLLRGAQTVGELRSRASRMEPIRDLAALQPILDSLISKGLVAALTPQGRGQVVAHSLYKPRELEALKAQYGAGAATGAPVAGMATEEDFAQRAAQAPESQSPRPQATAPLPAQPSAPASAPDPAAIEALQREIGELRAQVAQLRSDVEDLSARQGRTDDELRDFRDALGG